MSTLFPCVACLQMEIQPGDLELNISRLQNLLAGADCPPDTLVVLPEFWATGFDYPHLAELAEHTPELLGILRRAAAQGGIWLAGSLPEKGDEGRCFNTLFVVGPEGIAGKYRKHHLFGLWREDQYLEAGQGPSPVDTPFGPLAALVCYDLRFPETSWNQAFSGSRLIVVSAQWPLSRSDQWRILLQARAVENQAFVAACNGCGFVAAGELGGHSMIVDPFGQVLEEAGKGVGVIKADLAEISVDVARSRFCPVGERPWSGQDSSKIVRLEILQERLRRIRQQNSRIVFTNGCFDLLHAGHVTYLEKARRYGDCLVVGLNSDRSVRTLKGPSRPVNSGADRARVLAALGCVDFIVFFDEKTPFRLITTLLPDVLVKGADWPEEEIVGAADVRAAGGEIQRIPFDRAVSTTGIINKILSSSSG
ncbi:MAG: D-glycero-beta-D-manno-heptose 1-phosphate adenylyltransferase [Candidatus Electrothrix sp. YB6]